MTSLAPFSRPDFDVKEWVNEACRARASEEPLERCLAELEMRLHLLAEDLDASLEDDSARALQRIPNSIREASHVKGDAANLKADVDRILSKLTVASAASEASVATIADIDLAKTRMEDACTTLKEATELADMFQRVDAVFSSGNLQRISSLLATMRRSLSLVGNVPEFQGGTDRLQELEDRFQAMLEPQLTAALAERNGEKVQQIADFLAKAHQSEAVDSLYISVRMPQFQKAWDSFEPQNPDASFGEWLPRFFDSANEAVAAELKWALQYLPEHYPEIILLLLLTVFNRLEPAVASCLESALQQGGGLLALDTLAAVLRAVNTFANELREKLATAAQEDVVPLFEAIYAPFESQISRYGEFEAKRLQAEIDRIETDTSSASSSQQVVASLKAGTSEAVKLCQGASERCVRLTQATGIQALVGVVDQTLHGFITKLQGDLDGVGSRALSSLQASPSTASEQIADLLPVLTVASLQSSKVAILDAHLRGQISDLQEQMNASTGPASSLSPLSLRLNKSQGRLLRKLRQFTSNLDDPRFSCIPKATAAAAQFSDRAHDIIYSLLMHKLRAELQGVGTMPNWSAEESGNRYNLPAFSAYPQQYATAAGEYLMALPPLLETLLASTGTETEEDAAMNADWLDKVAIGAAELFADQVRQIPHLSQQGSLQLAADLEYFCNVLHALGVAVPTDLGTWQIATQWTNEDFAGASKAALEDGGVDPSVVQKVADVRRIGPGWSR